MKVVNCFAGAGAGKTTVALLTAGAMKQAGADCEYVDEWHKMSVWLNHGNVLEHPEMMLANQHQKQWALEGKVDIIISDCPLLLFAPYARKFIPNYPHDEFEELSMRINDKYENYNIWINRDPTIFKQHGRVQTLEQSIEMDQKIRAFVESKATIDYVVDNTRESVELLVTTLLKDLK